MGADRMAEDRFWATIEDARRSVDGDVEQLHDALVDRLAALTDEEILDFHLHVLTAVKRLSVSRLWAAAYLIMGGCSDDGFDSFLGWLVAQGPTVSDAALRDPQALLGPASAEAERGGYTAFEEMWSVAPAAHERRHPDSDTFDEEFDRRNAAFEPRGPVVLDWTEDDDLAAMFPALHARFWDDPL